MNDKHVVFTEPYAQRIKNVIESAEKIDLQMPSENRARLLANYTSPVEISGNWTFDGGVWRCLARRLWRVNRGEYTTIDDGKEFALFCPTASEQPPQGIGDRVFAVFRGVWEMVDGGNGASAELAEVVEPLRRPLFRGAIPDPFAAANTPEGNAASCMGTIKLPDKTYFPIELEPGIYQKRREPRTGSGRFVLRENGKTSEGFEWIYCDGTIYDGQGTTTDIEEAQYNYDLAICYNLDWSECLIEGDKVEFIERDGYYEVQPLKEIITPVHGQADVDLLIVKPEWDNPNNLGDPVTFTMQAADAQNPEHPDPPDFEAVYLKLENDHCTPKLVKTMGIANDCSSLRVRGVFVREDIKKRRYPMLFELAQLRAGGAIRSRQVTCYYKTQHDNCAPVMIQPEMKLIRLNEWRLSLSPTVCAISATALTDPTSTKPTHGNS